jgi:voltage-gated potassium channel
VKSYYDALVYVSTNLSVGYSDIFAKTPRGKAIGTALMTYGPAMSSKIFDTPTEATAPVVATAAAPAPAPAALIGSKEVLDRLGRILAVLEANRDANRAAQPPTA